MNNDFPCICGHYKSDHAYPAENIPVSVTCINCWFCAIAGTWTCTGFKLDNLKYLEQEYESKTK